MAAPLDPIAPIPGPDPAGPVDPFDLQAQAWDDDPAKVDRARRVAEAIVAQAGPLSGLRVLDYGCGTGLLGFALQPQVGHVTLADRSQGMLAVLRGKIAASGAGNLAALALDLAEGPLPGLRFDLIATLMVLHHVPDTDGILARFHALLAPGGRLCVADLDLEDGSFHGAGAQVHPGFDRVELAGRMERAGFRAVRFSSPFQVLRATAAGERSYSGFLAVAERG